MTISSVQLANFALGKVGTDSTIESLTEISAEAKICNLWFEHSRHQTLNGYAWSFATKRVLLADHTDDPSDDWAFRYIYPADCLAIRFIENPIGKTADPVPFKIEQSNVTKSILTDLREAKVIYTSDVTDTSLYTTYFNETFATILASHIAFSVTGQPDLAQALEARAQGMLVFGAAIDANEKQEAAPRQTDWIRGRS